MVRGLYIASTGMSTQAKRLDMISNDLANANTTGYKKQDTVITSFPEMLMARVTKTEQTPIGTVTLGAKVDSIYTNFNNGSVVKTSGLTDLAIQGDGFFTVNTPQGQAYTRDGGFIINPQGELVTQEGYAVMGENGPIQFEDLLEEGGDITISSDGTISMNGEIIDRLALVSFEDNQQLQKRENNLFIGVQPQEFEGQVLQGFLESSNVNIVSAMVDMITVSRAYEANQKMIQTQDTLLGKAVNELGNK